MNFTTGGDATRGSDYALNNGSTTLTGNSVTIAAGQSYVDVTLAVIDDAATEPTETASLTIQAGTGYEVGVSSSVAISIADDDAVVVSVSAIDQHGRASRPTSALSASAARAARLRRWW